MTRAELLTIGRELLQGKTLNTNSKFLSEKLTALGVETRFHSSCDDNIETIIKSITLAFKRADIVILTGGLGPTPDDVTRQAVAQYFQTDLRFHSAQYQYILRYFRKIKRKPTLITKQECYFPRIGRPILNQFGIALGFYVEYGKQILIALPGVPRELEALYRHSVEKLIQTKFKHLPRMHGFSVSLIGLDESEMMQKLGNQIFKQRSFEFGSYPMGGWVILRFRSKDMQTVNWLKREVRKKLGKFIFAWKDSSLESVIGEILKKKKISLAAAESCTGGLFSKRITDIPGSSNYFLGGVIAYANKTKENLLCVSRSTLKMHGAVSSEIAKEMAIGVRKNLKADIGISITGIAGPEGGSLQKPVGLVWIGLSISKHVFATKVQLAGERDRIRHSAVHRALVILYANLCKK